MTKYNSQVGGGEFHIQFETNDREHYERVQKVIRECIDHDFVVGNGPTPKGLLSGGEC